MNFNKHRILIQKFGGSSLSTKTSRQNAVTKVIHSVKKGFRPVIVVSAIGRKGDPYATDTLLSLIKTECPDLENKKLDLLMSCGEIISAVVIAAMLEREGFKTCVFTGGSAGIITDDNFGNASIIRIEPQALQNSIKRGQIPVIAGFQGKTEDGEITTLGRGGSDTTAVALGAALKSETVEIYTDVDGIMTADPRIVTKAQVLSKVSYYEVFEMANKGAKVINPRAVEIAMKHNLPVVVKNTFKNSSGTLIINSNSDFALETSPQLKPVTAVTHLSDIVQIRVKFKGLDRKKQSQFLNRLAQKGVSIDLINFLPDEKIFTVCKEYAQLTHSLLVADGFDISCSYDCSKVSVIGVGMTGIPGVMAKVVEALTDEGIQILQTSDSHITISCLIKREDEKKAVNALHEKFNLGGGV